MKAVFFSLFFLFVSACNLKNRDIHKKNGDTLIAVDLSVEDNFSIDEYFQYNSFIALETTNECLISDIDRIEFFKDNIYILDEKLGYVFIFHVNGKFSHKINRKGEGEKEYITANDFGINPQNNSIQIYDGTMACIVSYDLNGQFISRLNVEKGYSFKRLKNKTNLLYLGNSSSSKNFYNLKLYNNGGEFIKEYLPFNKYMTGRIYRVSGTKSVFSEYADTTYILPLLSNVIYTYNLSNQSVDKKYIIDFIGDEKYIDENSTSIEVEKFRSRLNNGSIASKVHNFYKIDNIIFFNFSYQNKTFLCLFDDVGKCVKLTRKFLDNHGLFFFPSVYYSDDVKHKDKVLSIMDGESFAISKNLKKTNDLIIREIDQSIGLIEDTNPILVFYDVKKAISPL
jgi:hypothetical protein